MRALTRNLGDAFSRHGWDDPDSLAFAIAQNARQTDTLNSGSAARLATSVFLERNGISPAELEEVISEVFSDCTLLPANRDYPELSTNTFEISGDHNVVSNVNLGGSQVVLNANSSKEDLLLAVSDLVRDGLENSPNLTDILELDGLLSSRGDIQLPEVEAAAGKAIEEVEADPGKLASFRDTVATSAASGLLVQGIMALLNSM